MHVEGHQRWVDLHKVGLSLGGTLVCCQASFNNTPIVYLHVFIGGEGERLLLATGLHPQEGQLYFPLLLHLHHLGNVANKGASITALLQGQLY